MAPGAAKLAVVAVDGRFQGGAVARRPTRDARAGFAHSTGGLVAEHHRVAAGDVPDGTFVEVVQVGTADADRRHAHLYLAGRGIGDFLLDNAEM